MFKKIDSFIGKRFLLDRKTVLPQGRHSEPSVVVSGNRKFVFKRSSTTKKLTATEAKKLVSAVKEYRFKLKKAGVHIPELHLIAPIQQPKKGKRYTYSIGSLWDFINEKNASQTIARAAPKKAVSTYKKIMVELFKAMTFSAKKKPIKSGLLIDSKPKNYVLGKDGKLYYVDFYTPKLTDKKDSLYPFIEKLHDRPKNQLQTMFEDKRALFHVLLAHSVAERPDLRKQFEEATLSFLRARNEQQVAKYIGQIIARNYRVSYLVKKEVLDKIPSSTTTRKAGNKGW